MLSSSVLPANSIVEAVSQDTFSSESVMRHLYEASKRTSGIGAHCEGQACLPRLVRFAREIEDRESPRASEDVLLKRISAGLEYAKAVLAELPDVEGVVLYGSVIRGKKAPGDYDIRVVTRYMEADTTDLVHPKMNARQTAVHEALKKSTSIPTEVAGLKLEVMVDSAFDDGLGMGLNYVEGCPYLAIMRGERPGALALFLNVAGTEYRTGRAA